MNDKFISKLKEQNITSYRLSKETMIPYTTINELVNGKISINNVSAEKVCKLSMYLGCKIDDILNDIPVYDRLHGNYKEYSYIWTQQKHRIKVSVRKNDKQVMVEYIKGINTDYPYKFAKLYSEAIIDNYLKEKEKDELYEKLFINAQR